MFIRNSRENLAIPWSGDGEKLMEITLFKERGRFREKIKFSGKTIKELLKKLKINPETVLVVRNDEILTEDEELKNKDRLEILSVISGG